MQFIKNFTQVELKKYLEENHSQPFRASQILDFIYHQDKKSFNEMANLPNALVEELNNNFEFSSVESAKFQISRDGATKFLFKLKRGMDIESVLIPDYTDLASNKYTLCVSTQAGCAIGCKFCATAKLSLQDNLETAEILDQYFSAKAVSGKSISNIVFMGMGEPLNNFDNVVKTIKILTDPYFGIMGRRRITLSTVGIVPKIKELADLDLGIKLAVSLHATDDDTRAKIIPLAQRWSIHELIEAAEYYYKSNRLPITYEYILFDNFNDSEKDVKKLAAIAKRFPSKINLIQFHQTENLAEFDLKATDYNKISSFKAALEREGVHAFIRHSAGEDIDAACGQLAYKNWDSTVKV